MFVVLMAAGIGWEAYKKNKMKNSGKSGGKENLVLLSLLARSSLTTLNDTRENLYKY